MQNHSDTLRTPGRREMFIGFFRIGLSGFGGVLPHARHALVERYHWLDDKQFTELLSLGQTLPGPNIVNMSVVIGARYHGWQGSVIALLALMSAPLVIVLSLASAYAGAGHVPWLDRLLAGVAAGAAGLVLATATRLASRLPRQAWTWLMMLLAFIGVFILRWPLLLILAILGPIGVACAWYELSRAECKQAEEKA